MIDHTFEIGDRVVSTNGAFPCPERGTVTAFWGNNNSAIIKFDNEITYDTICDAYLDSYPEEEIRAWFRENGILVSSFCLMPISVLEQLAECADPAEELNV